MRGSPIEVELGPEEGLKQPCCANLANVQTVRQSDLRRYLGSVSTNKMQAVCRALMLACGCD
jgi:mRNA-degrading endonuclease toxin of MazEF toxin-antitoxin module